MEFYSIAEAVFLIKICATYVDACPVTVSIKIIKILRRNWTRTEQCFIEFTI